MKGGLLFDGLQHCLSQMRHNQKYFCWFTTNAQNISSCQRNLVDPDVMQLCKRSFFILTRLFVEPSQSLFVVRKGDPSFGSSAHNFDPTPFDVGQRRIGKRVTKVLRRVHNPFLYQDADVVVVVVDVRCCDL